MPAHPDIVIIAAVASGNRVIGSKGKLPWNIKSDLAHFKAVTKKHVMIMGSNTWRSMNSTALPGRPHIVVTSDPDSLIIKNPKNSDVIIPVFNFEAAVMRASQLAQEAEQTAIYVIGGGVIYERALPMATHLIITEITNPLAKDGNGYLYTGDVVFPEINEDDWYFDRSVPMNKTGEPEYRIFSGTLKSSAQGQLIAASRSATTPDVAAP